VRLGKLYMPISGREGSAVWIPQDLADVVDWSLDAILLHFFLAFYHDDDAGDPVGCRHVW
jgi:hypothetical protein